MKVTSVAPRLVERAFVERSTATEDTKDTKGLIAGTSNRVLIRRDLTSSVSFVVTCCDVCAKNGRLGWFGVAERGTLSLTLGVLVLPPNV
jgi:hypothetical protein